MASSENWNKGQLLRILLEFVENVSGIIPRNFIFNIALILSQLL